jgi:hypothetical protein
MSAVILGKLPDPFLKEDGTRMSADEWYAQRDQCHKLPDFTEFLQFVQCKMNGRPTAEHLKITPYPNLDIDTDWTKK